VYFDIYYQSLANPEKDRGYKNRLKGIPSRENVRVKTGFIAGASTFSGYIKGPGSGHLLAFSIMINNYSCEKSYAEAWEDSLVAEILKDY
jgi:D-alanyl-D-alanine carboxypeptidase